MTGKKNRILKKNRNGNYLIVFLSVLLALCLSLAGAVSYTSATEDSDAEDTGTQNTDTSTSGITYELSIGSSSNEVIITVIIPEGYEGETITFDADEAIKEAVNSSSFDWSYPNSPGYSGTIQVRVLNNSDYDYSYVNGSLIISDTTDPQMELESIWTTVTILHTGYNIHRYTDNAILSLLKKYNVFDGSSDYSATATSYLEDEDGKFTALLEAEGYDSLAALYVDYYNTNVAGSVSGASTVSSLSAIPYEYFYQYILKLSTYDDVHYGAGTTVLETESEVISYLKNYFENLCLLFQRTGNSGYYTSFADCKTGTSSIDNFSGTFAANSTSSVKAGTIEFYIDWETTANTFQPYLYGFDFSIKLNREEKETETENVVTLTSETPSFVKTLDMSDAEGASVPKVSFTYTITAGEAVEAETDAEGNEITQKIYAGVFSTGTDDTVNGSTSTDSESDASTNAESTSTDTRETYDSDDSGNDSVSTAADESNTSATVYPMIGTVDFTTNDYNTDSEGNPYVYVSIDFSGVEFTKAGIYRYMITETASDTTDDNYTGITNDSNNPQYLDVYVVGDDSVGYAVQYYVFFTKVTARPDSENQYDETEDADDSTAESEATASVKSTGYTNYYKTYSLTLKKEVTDADGSADSFAFTVVFSGGVEGTKITCGDKTAIFDSDGTCKITGISLKSGESVTFTGLTSDIKYTISESATGYTATATCVSGSAAADTSGTDDGESSDSSDKSDSLDGSDSSSESTAEAAATTDTVAMTEDNGILTLAEQTMGEADNTVTVTNSRKTGKITVSKVDADDKSKVLSGATFTLTNSNGETVSTQTTDTNGTVMFSGLAWGTYTITETKAPTGYKLDSNNSQKVTIGASTVSATQTVTFQDTQTSFALDKVDVDSFADPDSGSITSVTKLNGVSLTFTGVTDTATEEWTLIWSRNAEGIESYTISQGGTTVSTAVGTEESPSVVIMGLPAGTYVLTAESEIPAGYASIETNKYQLIISDEGSLTTNSVDGNPISISGETVTVSDKKIKVVINKKDSEDIDLSGAEFTVTPVGSGTFADGTSSSIVVNGDDSEDLYGKLVGGCSYKVSETTVPDGYTQADDFILKVEEDGSVSVTSYATSESSASSSTEDGNISCKLNESTDVYEVSVVDETFAITVKKQSSTTKSALGGAEFVLYQKTADNTWEEVTVKNSSGENTPVTISTDSVNGLAVLKSIYEDTVVMKINGTYRLVEAKAADGYILPTDANGNNLYVEFTVGTDGSIQKTSNSTNFANLVTVDSEPNVITVKNEPISITLIKADGGYAGETDTTASVTGYLEGVSFTLSDQKEGYSKNSKTAATDTDGQISFATDERGFQLIAGHTYKITESAPTGYYGIEPVLVYVSSDGTVSLTEDYSDSVNCTSVTVSGTQITVIDTRKKGAVTVTKTTEDGATALSGVEFTLYKNKTEDTEESVTTETEIAGSLITDDKGTVTWNGLAWGTYTIVETAAPAGYTLNSEKKTVTITADSVASVQTVTYTDCALDFTIKKVDETGTAISGASFELSKVKTADAEASEGSETDASTLAILTSNDNGVLVWGDHSNAELMKLFQVGETYSLTEVVDYSTTAFSYVALTSAVTFKVENNGTLTLVSNGNNPAELSKDALTLTITNTRTSFILNKVDADDTKISLNDVSLTFTGAADTVTEGWTLVWTRDEYGKESYKITYTDADTGEKELFSETNDTSGAIAIKGLPVGTYTLTAESNIPEGYVSAVGTGYQLTINSDGTVVYSAGSSEISVDTNLVTIADAKQSLMIKKTDADSTAIIGKTVVFSVTGVFAGDDNKTTKYVTAEGNSLSEAYSGEAISVLEDGELVAGQTYVLTEVVAPDGYVLSNVSVTFTVGADGTIEIKNTEEVDDTATASEDTVSFKDDPISITLVNIDGLYDGTGIETMSAGGAGNGDGDESGESGDSGSGDTGDDGTGDETATGGVTFTLIALDEDGNEIEDSVQTAATDADGKLTFGTTGGANSFAVVGGTSYVLRETTVAGYYDIADIEIKINMDGTVTIVNNDEWPDTHLSNASITKDGADTDAVGNAFTAGDTIIVKNIRKTGLFSFSKAGLYNETCAENADATKALAGVTFTAYSDEALTTVAATAVSKEDGSVVFEELAPGTYYICETETADGYVLDSKVYTAVAAVNAELNEVEVTLYQDREELSDNNSYTIVNDVYRSDFSFTKVSEEDSTQVITGATYGLYRCYSSGASETDSSGETDSQSETGSSDTTDSTGTTDSELTLIATCVSDANGLVSFKGLLMDVEYTVIELEEPSGSYRSANAISFNFTINSPNGTVATNWISTGEGTVVQTDEGNLIWNEPQTIVSIEKVDADGNALAGATLQIQDASGNPIIIGLDGNGNPITSWISTGEALVLTGILSAGKTYKLVELDAPDGYAISESVEFTVPDDAVSPGKDTTITVTMVDLPSQSEPTEQDDSVQPPTEQPTEPVTEPSTGAPTEPVTESSTEKATEPTTEKLTEETTVAAGEVQTEALTEMSTETITESETLPETVVSGETEETEPQTETAVKSGTESETESETEDSVTTEDEMRPYFWMSVMLLCALAMLKAGSSRRRQKKHN